MSAIKIGIVDDDEEILAATRSLVRSFGYAVETFASADQLLGSGAVDRFDCIISDIEMPGLSGLELLARLAFDGAPPVIIMTAKPGADLQAQAVAAGAAGFLRKPFDAQDLVDRLVAILGP